MSKGEFNITFEAQRADTKDPMSQDHFAVTKIELDGRNITLNTTGADDAMLEAALKRICERVRR